MDEGHAVSEESLHDEPFTAEEARTEALLKRDSHLDATRGAEERILLAENLAADLGEVDREDLSRVGGRERDLLAAVPSLSSQKTKYLFVTAGWVLPGV